ncbi:MAG: hypothetical protein LUC33_04920 [Prevotellaceae bacterium]|nr:hypothetical protein [Prevotellaceae bacterium]
MGTAEQKRRFLEGFNRRGRISEGLDSSGVAYSMLRSWRRSDPEFRREFEDVCGLVKLMKAEQLMDAADAGDVKAMIYGMEHPQEAILDRDDEREDGAAAKVEADGSGTETREIRKRIEGKKRYMIQVLKREGKYTAELSMQVTLAAQLLVKVETLSAEIFSETHRTMTVDLYRNGAEHEVINPKEKLYLSYVDQAWKALRALGMNTDAKERRTDGPDTFADFLENLNGDGK